MHAVIVSFLLLQSFSAMFVKFLEIESTPSLPAAKLPAHDIKALGVPPPRRTNSAASSGAAGKPPVGREASFSLLRPQTHGTLFKVDASLFTGAVALGKRLGESNPFLAARSAAVPLLAGSSSGGLNLHFSDRTHIDRFEVHGWHRV